MWPNWGAITFCMSFKGRFYQPWWGVKKFCNELEEVDEYLLRQILNAHSKTPKEMLYRIYNYMLQNMYFLVWISS